MLRSLARRALAGPLPLRPFSIAPHMKDLADFDLPELPVDREVALKHPNNTRKLNLYEAVNNALDLALASDPK